MRILTNLYSRNENEKLYHEHVNIIRCIIEQDHDSLDRFYKNHIYRGMYNLTDIVSKLSDYFVDGLAR
ncbi:MAG: hypothetical protein GX185_03945 [Tissierellia bacterium]|nr:hypothetical protein [Tissierellia bacterium]